MFFFICGFSYFVSPKTYDTKLQYFFLNRHLWFSINGKQRHNFDYKTEKMYNLHVIIFLVFRRKNRLLQFVIFTK